MKRSLFVLLVLLILILAACSPSNNAANVPGNDVVPGNNTEPSNTVPGNNVDPQPPANDADPQTPANTVQVDIEAERWERLYETGIHDPEDLAFFLNGTWSMLPAGEQPGVVQDYADMTIDASTKTAVFELKLGGPSKAVMTFTSTKLYSEMKNAPEDVIFFNVTAADGSILNNSNGIVGNTSQYQIFVCRYKDNDIMFLRPLGNGVSEMTLVMLDPAGPTSDGCFMFVRKGGTMSKKVLDDKFYEENRYMAVTFMAMRWVDREGSCYLVPMVFEYFQDTFYDKPEDLIRIGYNSKNALYCIKYEMQDDNTEKGSGAFDPRLVEITVEGDTKITEKYVHPYVSYGVYDHGFEKPAADPDKRDSSVYGKTDGIFLGKWVDISNSKNTAVISEASPQVGGYKIDFMFDDVKVNGYANISDGDTLYINQGYVNGNIRIEGVLQKVKQGISFCVTKCDWTAAPSGTVFIYAKEGSAQQGPTGGEGSENRDPEKFSFCDWFFPKTWYLRDDHKKTLTVTMDSLQVGGYKIVFTTPDGGKAECYGYPEDGMYIILDQAIINGKYRITGYLEQVDEVLMRLFVTASDYKSLPVGTMLVYDPRK